MLVFFTILSLISIATIIAVQQTPTQETVTSTVGTYTSTANYDYIAELGPNMIYGNATTLKPGEGTLYARITKQINLSLTYAFSSTVPATPTILYNVTRTLQTAAWQYQTASTPQTITNQTTINMILPPFSEATTDPIIASIDNETGTTTLPLEYSLDITPTFTVNANTQQGAINQVFTPTLTISLNQTAEGSVITIGELNQTETGALTQTQTITHKNVLNERYASYVLAAASVTGLALSALFYRKNITTQPKPQIEKLIAEHKDLIVETTENIESPQTTTIKVKTLEELVKTAEILAKPILHTTKDQKHIFYVTKDKKHIFYIIDDNTKYQYENSPAQPEQPKPTTEQSEQP
jgi:hypothetical protein